MTSCVTVTILIDDNMAAAAAAGVQHFGPAAPLDPKRKNDVTASDAPAIFGENPYPGANWRGVMHKKILQISEIFHSEATDHGHKYEPVAIEEFCNATGAIVTYPGYSKHAVHTWFGGTVDGEAEFTREIEISGVKFKPGDKVIIEVKCPLKRPIKGEIPTHYIGQVQSYLEIHDKEYCIFIEYKPPGPRSAKKLSIIAIKRDRFYMSLRMPILKRFWDEMQLRKAYLNVIVTIIQRAWRTYLSKRRLESAIARRRMLLRMARAPTFGKIAVFFKRKEMDLVKSTALLDYALTSNCSSTVCVDFSKMVFTAPPESKRPRHEKGICFVFL